MPTEVADMVLRRLNRGFPLQAHGLNNPNIKYIQFRVFTAMHHV